MRFGEPDLFLRFALQLNGIADSKVDDQILGTLLQHSIDFGFAIRTQRSVLHESFRRHCHGRILDIF